MQLSFLTQQKYPLNLVDSGNKPRAERRRRHEHLRGELNHTEKQGAYLPYGPQRPSGFILLSKEQFDYIASFFPPVPLECMLYHVEE